MAVNSLDRFYPRPVSIGDSKYFEVYDCVEHRVLGTTSDWFDALHRCYKFRDCGKSNPVQLSINFGF